jgi:hypothetical protein
VGLSLVDQMSVIENIHKELAQLRGKSCFTKTGNFSRKESWIQIHARSEKKTFTGEKLENPEDAQVEWSMYKHARLTSCDVKRSYSW